MDFDHRMPEGIINQLDEPLPKEMISQRQGGGGRMLDYITWMQAVRNANKLFGPDNYDVEVREMNEREIWTPTNQGPMLDGIFYSCVVRVTLSWGMVSEGVGTGQALFVTRNGRMTPAQQVDAMNTGIKKAASNGIKRALARFGNQFGLGLYEKTEDIPQRQAAAGKQAPQGQAVRGKQAPQQQAAAGKQAPQPPPANPQPGQAYGAGGGFGWPEQQPQEPNDAPKCQWHGPMAVSQYGGWYCRAKLEDGSRCPVRIKQAAA